MLESALLLDGQGRRTLRHLVAKSNAWSDVEQWTDRFYMPIRATPTASWKEPRSEIWSAQVGRVSVTRFTYGIPIRVQSDGIGDPTILTNVRGTVRHNLGRNADFVTNPGESFVIDCGNTVTDVEGDAEDMQLNITLPRDLLSQIGRDWFGFEPGIGLWQHKCPIGGVGSSWHALLEYLVRCIAEAPDRLAQGPVGRHLEQTICVHLLNEWTGQAGIDMADPVNRLAPRTVRVAEQYMTEHAIELPDIIEVARAAGASPRTLSAAFKEFRGYTPSRFLKEQRLQGVRRDLLTYGRGDAVGDIALNWGFISMGEFARSYRNRFGERPSETFRRR